MQNPRISVAYDEIVQQFEEALYLNDEGKMAALIFPGSPILSSEAPTTWKESYLQYLYSIPYPNIFIIRLLIKFGINLNHQDAFGQTILHRAASMKDPADPLDLNMMKLFVKEGANREIRNNDGLTPIQVSLFSGNLDAAEQFLKEEHKIPNVIDVNKIKRHRQLVKCLLPEENVSNVYITNYSVLLHFLILQNDEETFEHVVNISEFNVNAINHDGERLLHAVAKSGTPRMIKALINIGADVDANCLYVDANKHSNVNETPLIKAIKYGRIENVRCLLDCGASVYKVQKQIEKWMPTIGGCLWPPPTPRTPLECALNYIRKDSVCKDIIELLISNGADVNVPGSLPLHLAFQSDKKMYEAYCIYGRPATIKLLLECNANINTLDKEGLVPFHYSIRNYCLKRDTEDLSAYNLIKAEFVTVIAFIAKLIESGEFVRKENLILLENEFVRPIYHHCVKELSLLKKHICELSNFSFYDILCKDINKVGGALKNKDLLQVLKSGEYKKEFPLYAEFLETRIQKAEIRQSLVDLGIVPFRTFVYGNISVEEIFNIFYFLNIRDLKSFAKACFVDCKRK